MPSSVFWFFKSAHETCSRWLQDSHSAGSMTTAEGSTETPKGPINWSRRARITQRAPLALSTLQTRSQRCECTNHPYEFSGTGKQRPNWENVLRETLKTLERKIMGSQLFAQFFTFFRCPRNSRKPSEKMKQSRPSGWINVEIWKPN